MVAAHHWERSSYVTLLAWENNTNSNSQVWCWVVVTFTPTWKSRNYRVNRYRLSTLRTVYVHLLSHLLGREQTTLPALWFPTWLHIISSVLNPFPKHVYLLQGGAWASYEEPLGRKRHRSLSPFCGEDVSGPPHRSPPNQHWLLTYAQSVWDKALPFLQHPFWARNCVLFVLGCCLDLGVLLECHCEMLHIFHWLPPLWRDVDSVDGILQGNDLRVFWCLLWNAVKSHAPSLTRWDALRSLLWTCYQAPIHLKSLWPLYQRPTLFIKGMEFRFKIVKWLAPQLYRAQSKSNLDGSES